MENKKIPAVLIAALSAVLVPDISAETYTWQSDGSGYDGNFTNAAHWGGVSVPGATAEQAGDIAVFPHGVGDYTVTFPAGTVTNYAACQFHVGRGETVRIEGSGCVLENPPGDYKKFLFSGEDSAGNDVAFLGFGNTPASQTFTDFNAVIACDFAGNNTLCLDGGTYSLSNAFVYAFSYGQSCSYKADTGGSYRPGSVVIALTNASFTCHRIDLGTAAPTNRLIVSGGTFATSALYDSYWNSPNQPNDVKTLKEIVFTDSATADFSSWIQPGYYQADRLNSSNQTLRVRVDDGSSLSIHSLQWTALGAAELLVSGEGSSFCHTSGSSIGAGRSSFGYVGISDGAVANLRDRNLLGSSEYPDTSWGEFCVSNAILNIPNQASIVVQNGRVSLLDGTVVTMTGGTTDSNIRGEGSATREILCDGVVINYRGAVADPIAGFPAIRLGPKGLTLAATAYEHKTISGTYTDASTGGRLVLKPYYDRETWQRAMTISGTGSDESYLDITVGKVYLAEGANHYSFLTVTNNAVFSLAGEGYADGATLRGLKLGDETSGGTLALDPGDVITLSGPFDIEHGSINFSSVLTDGAHTVFSMTVEPSAELVSAWEMDAKMSFVSGLDSSKYNVFTVEKAGDVWNFVITVYSTVPSKEADAVWAGGGDRWETAANWQNAAMPSETYGALFSGAAPTEVTVDGAVTTTGITFDSPTGYTISGGEIDFAFSRDSAIGVTGGAHCVSSDIVSKYLPTTIAVEEGAELSLSGTFTGAGIVKTGAGALKILSPFGNHPGEGVTLQEGSLYASDTVIDSLGDLAPLTLAGGVLHSTGSTADRANIVVAGDVVVNAGAGGSSIAVPSGTSGSLIKSGPETLTINVGRDRTMNAAVKVREGVLVIEGDGVHALAGLTSVSLLADALSSENAPDTALVVNNVKKLSVEDILGIGEESGDGSVSYSPSLAVTNSYLSVGACRISYNNIDQAIEPVITFSNSTLSVFGAGGVHPGGMDKSSAKMCPKWFFTDSRLQITYSARRFNTMIAPYEMTFDNSTLCYFHDGIEDSIEIRHGGGWGTAHGKYLFKNGSKLCCSHIMYADNFSTTAHNPRYDFTFEDSEWFVSFKDGEVPSYGMNVNIEARGDVGIVFAPPEDRTWTLYTVITGDGALTKRGAGTLDVVAARKHGAALEDPVTIKTTGAIRAEGGLLRIASGVIDNFASRRVAFADGGTLDYGEMALVTPELSGEGTLTNAVVSKPTLALGRAEDGSPTGCVAADFASVTGRIAVDFGRSADDVSLGSFLDATFVVARWFGVKPDAAKWRVRNAGRGLSAQIAVNDDGTVEATVCRKNGIAIVVR